MCQIEDAAGAGDRGYVGLTAFRRRFSELPADVMPSLVQAWCDTADSFCILYRWGTVAGLFGLRAEWRVGWFDSPTAWGVEMVDEVCEPLGTVADHLVIDDAGVRWWGAVALGTPTLPEV